MGRKKRPLGITILGIYILLLALMSFITALNYMEGNDLPEMDDDPMITALSPLVLGSIYFLLGVSKLGVAVGVFMMKRTAWGGAFFIISIGMLFDLLNGHYIIFLAGLFALFYLLASKKQFRYW